MKKTDVIKFTAITPAAFDGLYSRTSTHISTCLSALLKIPIDTRLNSPFTTRMNTVKIGLLISLISILLLGLYWLIQSNNTAFVTLDTREHFIVQGHDIETVTRLTEQVGGQITHQLPIVNAIGAVLDSRQRLALLENPQVRAIYLNEALKSGL